MSRITRMPSAFDPDRGAEARASVPQVEGDLAALIFGAGGCSPYLNDLTVKEADWLPSAFDDPEAAVLAIFAALEDCAPDQLERALRQAKRRIALLTGLADLAGVWPLEEVTGTLTRFADLACQVSLRAAIGAEIRRKKLPGATEEDAQTGGGMVALAMGKMGAFELNYSSDIDLICLFDESRFDRDDYFEARASFVRATRKMAAMLNDTTADGYVFRTDLRLRPDPAVTPVCMAMAGAEAYYESLGRTWERAAYIKARPAAGDIAAGQAFLKTLKPFVWRKHLDFAAIQDAHDMRLRIREHKGLGGGLVLEGHNMELGRGGVRRVKLFTQTRQLIAGGRDPSLRLRGTVEGLWVLSAKGWVPEATASTLSQHYRAHREVEHRVQMINDAQTHALPKTEEGFARLAAFMGTEVASLRADLEARLTEVHTLTEGFFAPEAPSSAPQSVEVSDFDHDVIGRWRGYPALRSDRGTEIFKRLQPEILARLKATPRPDEALLAFDGFLAGLPAGVQLFSLFEANPQLIDLMVDIVGTSPALSAHLARNSSVFDAVIGGGFFAAWPGMAALEAELAQVLASEMDYERMLDTARRWAKEWHFRVGVHHLRGLIDAKGAGAKYADLAEAVLRALWPQVVAHFSQKHGPCPGRGAMIMGMGSLGAGRLNAMSDLDLIVIYDADGDGMSEGRRPLNTRTYYARLTQAMVTAVTAAMAEGRLYEIDMRLRPSGSKGPVATSLTSFKDYQRTQAWVWEHLALTRARPVAGDAALCAEVEAFRVEVLAQPRDAQQVLDEVTQMRARIKAAKSPDGPWDAKLGAGRLQDVELIAQAATLLAGRSDRDIHAGLEAGVAIGWLNAAERDALARAYDLFWKVQGVSRLLSEKPLEPATIGEGGCRMILRETGAEAIFDLEADLHEVAESASGVIDAVLAHLPGQAPE